MRSRFRFLALLVSVTVATLGAIQAHAQWAPNGVGAGVADNDQLNAAVCPDGKGGAIIVWADARGTPYSFDIYAQRVNANGQPLWATNGVPICTAAGDQTLPVVTPDGASGAIIAWEDFRHNDDDDVYAQRVDSLGTLQWLATGVPVCTDTNGIQTAIQIVGDNAGGAIVVWEDYRNFSPDVFAQRLNAAGAPQWTVNGRAVCSADEEQFTPQAVADGAGGAVITWFDARDFDFDIYAQRINNAGTSLWTANGVKVCGASGTQSSPVIASDGASGAVIAWEDFRDDIFSFDVYVQRVNASGTRLWLLDGVPLVDNDFDQVTPAIASDGAGGAIVSWQDDRAIRPDIYAQRVNASGVPQWTAGGIGVCTMEGTQQIPRMVSDGANGAIVIWEDLRKSLFNTDLYAQRIGPTGTILWAANGVPMTSAGADQVHQVIVTDGAGGAIAAWDDGRGGMNSDVFVQRVTASGLVGPTTTGVWDERPSALAGLAVQPNPCRALTRLTFALARDEAVSVAIYDLNGRRVRELANGRLRAGSHMLPWDARDANGAPVENGVYWLRVASESGDLSRKVTVLH